MSSSLCKTIFFRNPSKCFTLARPVNLVFRYVKKNAYIQLAEVGKFETPKIEEKYDTGQLFFHSVFGYRGSILFPWVARVYERDVPNKKEPKPIVEDPSSEFIRLDCEVKSYMHTYYQVLIDSRDCPFVRIQTEAVTYLYNQDNSTLVYSIPGLDYVAHKDILPYTSTETQPIQHELFDKFFKYNPEKDPPFFSKENLRAWQEKKHPWLELSGVYKDTTENIRVTVIPFYLGCKGVTNSMVYCWRYCIRLENLGHLTVQLRKRNWRIFSSSGVLESIQGCGVNGQEPVLSKDQPAFQYSSHVSLQAQSGHMWGTFRMEREDGHIFDCRIPSFSLESKQDASSSSEDNNPN